VKNIQQISQKIGFWETLTILAKNHFKPILLREFYKQLSETSYYNAFYRIKDVLLKHEIITIYKSNKKRYIGLKTKGLTLIKCLYQCDNLLQGDWFPENIKS